MNKLTQLVFVRRSDIDDDLAKFLDASEFRAIVSRCKYSKLDRSIEYIIFHPDLNMENGLLPPESSITPISEFKQLIGYTEPSKFSVEQCKADGWRCMFGDKELILVTEKSDKNGDYVCFNDAEYIIIKYSSLRNIEKEEYCNLFQTSKGKYFLKPELEDEVYHEGEKLIATIPMHKLKNIDWSKVA